MFYAPFSALAGPAESTGAPATGLICFGITDCSSFTKIGLADTFSVMSSMETRPTGTKAISSATWTFTSNIFAKVIKHKKLTNAVNMLTIVQTFNV